MGTRAVGTNPVVGFLPWIIFWVVANPHTWEYAVSGALVAAVILVIPDLAEHRKLKSLDIGSIGFFGVLTVLGLVLDRSDLQWLEDYAQAISSGILAVIALGSLVVGIPFVEQYAREMTPPERWKDPIFKRNARLLTTMWGVIFLVTAILGAIGEGETGDMRGWLEWILPIALLVGGFTLQGWVIQRQRARRERAGLDAA